ncbi:TonB-dependent receptor [Sneathiella chinensis]|uniref:TonB-dependent receptor n=2 Tax=Sneathiella chinensis TaxID=349750 RepID=A0ABQ5U5C5_9PROT|nr:TonB-dependent receptor [Sneathiella chinensis]
MAWLIVSPALADTPLSDSIVVSASRTPIEAEKVGRAYTVLTAEDLEQTQTRYVSDALRRIPGVSVSRNGAFGGPVQVRLRGSEGNHVLVLIDGIEVSEPTQGEFDFGSMQAADIERIEVIRGPQSALWGSNATAGVINIITKGGKRNSFETHVNTEVGTDRTLMTNVGVRGGGNRYDYAVSGAFRRTDGFNTSSFGSEEDGDRNLTLNARGSVDLTPTVQLDGSLRHVRRTSDTDDQDFAWPATPTNGLAIDTDADTRTRDFFGSVGLTSSHFDDAFVHSLRFEGTSTRRRSQDLYGLSGNEGTRYHGAYQATLSFDTPDVASARHSLTGSVEWERETFKNIFPLTPSQIPSQSRTLYGFVTEYRGEFFENLFVTGAVRFDHNDSFDDAVTYSLSGAYVVPGTGTRFHSSVGTGVTNPTFLEQFGFDPSTFIGNPSLKPEENFGWDLGVEQKFLNDDLVVDVTYFQERLTDEIQSQYDFMTGLSSPINLDGTSKRRGVEIAASAQVTDNLHLRAAYTYLNSKEPNGAEEVRRPRHSGSFGATYSFLENRASIFTDVAYNGEMQDLEFVGSTPRTRVTLDDYVLVTVGADYKVTDDVLLYGRIENMLDDQYQEIYSFNGQGLTAFVGVKATF